jgi:predicted secreted protein
MLKAGSQHHTVNVWSPDAAAVSVEASADVSAEVSADVSAELSVVAAASDDELSVLLEEEPHPVTSAAVIAPASKMDNTFFFIS